MIASLEKIIKMRAKKISKNSYGAICAVENGKFTLDGVEYNAAEVLKFDAVRYSGEKYALIDCGNMNYFSAKFSEEGVLMKN